MTKVNNLEMANAIANNPHIRINKTFFGLSENVVYEPTGSRVRLMCFDFDQSEGSYMNRLLALPVEKLAHEIDEKGKPQGQTIGNYRLEAALSDDRQFLMMQLFQFSDFQYRGVSEVLVYEGAQAEAASVLLPIP